MLKVTKDFVQGEYRLVAGETYEGPASVEDWMLSSFPAHFEVAVAAPVLSAAVADEALTDEPAARVEAESFEAPPAHKMVKRPAAKK